jgi:hypothetical protein
MYKVSAVQTKDGGLIAVDTVNKATETLKWLNDLFWTVSSPRERRDLEKAMKVAARILSSIER